MARFTERWRRIRHLPQEGDLYRLIDPRAGRWAAWMCVRQDRREALVTCVRIMTEIRHAALPLVLRGLDPTQVYAVTEQRHADAADVGRCYQARGDALMALGLRVERMDDFTAITWHLEAVG